jgi:GNAT superfamily N-acetyltransferase
MMVRPFLDVERIAELNALSRVSLGNRRYGREFLDSCRSDLELKPQDLKDGDAMVEEDHCDRVTDELYIRAFAHARPMPDDDRYLVTHFYVDPRFTGQGIGARLWIGFDA